VRISGILRPFSGGDEFVIFGSGKPLRQFIYSRDLAEQFIWVLRNYDDVEPIILCGKWKFLEALFAFRAYFIQRQFFFLSVDEKDEVSISYVAEQIAEALNFKGQLVYDTSKADGQYKKTASNAKLRRLNPTLQFTPFREAIKETVNWFTQSRKSARL